MNFITRQSDGIPNKTKCPTSKTLMVTLGGPGIPYLDSQGEWQEGGFGKDMKGHMVGDVDQQAGPMMHEQGHALGLKHGYGFDSSGKPVRIEYQPNYLSVMNYAFQFSSLLGKRSLDYSRCDMGHPNETNLSETTPTGIGISCPPGMDTNLNATGIKPNTSCGQTTQLVRTGPSMIGAEKVT
jgi:hypothetical protein